MQTELIETGELKRSLEAVLFVASEALSIDALVKLSGATHVEVAESLQQIAEDYAERRISEDTAASIKAAPWFDNLAWIVGDPAAADARMTLRRHGVKITPADNAKDVSKDGSGIAKIRWALQPQGGIPPFLYFDKRCVNIIRSIRHYHNPEHRAETNAIEVPAKVDDHGADATRYCVAKLIKRTS